jgi:hypothetical protein
MTSNIEAQAPAKLWPSSVGRREQAGTTSQWQAQAELVSVGFMLESAVPEPKGTANRLPNGIYGNRLTIWQIH